MPLPAHGRRQDHGCVQQPDQSKISLRFNLLAAALDSVAESDQRIVTGTSVLLAKFESSVILASFWRYRSRVSLRKSSVPRKLDGKLPDDPYKRTLRRCGAC